MYKIHVNTKDKMEDYGCWVMNTGELGIITNILIDNSQIKIGNVVVGSTDSKVIFPESQTYGRAENYRYRRLTPGESVVFQA